MTVHEIAERLGMSDTPIREALKRLEAEGYVESVSHSGYRVAALNRKEIEELFIVRGGLERLAFELALPAIDSQLVAKLKKLMKQMEASLKQGNLQAWRRTNREFHNTIYRRCNNNTLFTLIWKMWERSGYVRGIFTFTTERAIECQEEHLAIVTSMEKGNSTEAIEALRHHLAKSLEAMLTSEIVQSGKN